MLKPSPIEQFIEAINGSAKLKRECQGVLDGSRGPKAFVQLGAKHGYKFSQVQTRAYFRSILQAPSAKAVSERQVGAIVGAKDAAELGQRDPQLLNAVLMLRGMSFKKTPSWTGFGFVRSVKARSKAPAKTAARAKSA